jgi:hypothetical protein
MPTSNLLDELRREVGDKQFEEIMGERDLPDDIINRLRKMREVKTKTERQQLEVAIRYDRHFRAGTGKPRQEVADDMTLSSNRIGNILTECRRKGFLTGALPGRAGGTLTDKAKQRARKLGLETDD